MDKYEHGRAYQMSKQKQTLKLCVLACAIRPAIIHALLWQPIRRSTYGLDSLALSLPLFSG